MPLSAGTPATGKCCDMCYLGQVEDKNDSPIARPVDKTSRREELDIFEAERVRNALMEWREKMYEEHFNGFIHDTEESVITDYMLDKAVKNYKNIIESRSIDILRWNPLRRVFSRQVLELIMGLGEQFSKEKQERNINLEQDKKRRQQSEVAPSFGVPLLIDDTTGRPERKDTRTVSLQETIATVSHDQQRSVHERKRAADPQPQQASESKDLPQWLLKPLQSPEKKPRTAQKRGRVPEKSDLNIIQYLVPQS